MLEPTPGTVGPSGPRRHLERLPRGDPLLVGRAGRRVIGVQPIEEVLVEPLAADPQELERPAVAGDRATLPVGLPHHQQRARREGAGHRVGVRSRRARHGSVVEDLGHEVAGPTFGAVDRVHDGAEPHGRPCGIEAAQLAAERVASAGAEIDEALLHLVLAQEVDVAEHVRADQRREDLPHRSSCTALAWSSTPSVDQIAVATGIGSCVTPCALERIAIDRRGAGIVAARRRGPRGRPPCRHRLRRRASGAFLDGTAHQWVRRARSLRRRISPPKGRSDPAGRCTQGRGRDRLRHGCSARCHDRGSGTVQRVRKYPIISARSTTTARAITQLSQPPLAFGQSEVDGVLDARARGCRPGPRACRPWAGARGAGRRSRPARPGGPVGAGPAAAAGPACASSSSSSWPRGRSLVAARGDDPRPRTSGR